MLIIAVFLFVLWHNLMEFPQQNDTTFLKNYVKNCVFLKKYFNILNIVYDIDYLYMFYTKVRLDKIKKII